MMKSSVELIMSMESLPASSIVRKKGSCKTRS